MKSVFFKLSFIVIIIIALMILSPRQSLLSQKYDDESVFVNVTVAGQVQRVLLDDYLLGVVAGEMPASFELEAIKAQVVASRTFVYSRLLSVDNTTNTQVYLNEEEMKMCDGLIIQGGPHLGSSHICALHNSVAREEIFENDDCVFKVTGISDDNVIEVTESKSDWWCVGVQFHPELETENLKLFEKLIEKSIDNLK